MELLAGRPTDTQEIPPEPSDGPTGFDCFRLECWQFADLTPIEMKLLDRLWNKGRFRGDEGYVADTEAVRAVYGETPGDFAEKLDAARKRLNRKLVAESDGAVSISSRRNQHKRLHYRLDVNPPAGTKGGQQEYAPVP